MPTNITRCFKAQFLSDEDADDVCQIMEKRFGYRCKSEGSKAIFGHDFVMNLDRFVEHVTSICLKADVEIPSKVSHTYKFIVSDEVKLHTPTPPCTPDLEPMHKEHIVGVCSCEDCLDYRIFTKAYSEEDEPEEEIPEMTNKDKTELNNLIVSTINGQAGGSETGIRDRQTTGTTDGSPRRGSPTLRMGKREG